MVTPKYFLLLFTCLNAPAVQPDDPETIHYFSLNHAIKQAQFDRVVTVGELTRYGDFGLGSAEKISDEFVMLDGIAYGIPADGIARKMEQPTGIAFAVVKKFTADTVFFVEGISSLAGLEKYLGHSIDQNSFAAIRVEGFFSTLTCRSFVQQEKPYPPLKKVHEVLFRQKEKKATLVGFYTPASAAVLNTPVYHFHCITDDKNSGGHVKECSFNRVSIAVDYAQNLHVQLPQKKLLENIDLTKKAKPE
jgi:acetolactate decarboxylase